MPRFRVFVQDIGDRGYSGLDDVTAASPEAAIRKAGGAAVSSHPPYYSACGHRLIALPHNRKDLWPHHRTGAVKAAALHYGESK
jgi:hypothetical protein